VYPPGEFAPNPPPPPPVFPAVAVATVEMEDAVLEAPTVTVYVVPRFNVVEPDVT
jgi:hypothetical protein